MRGRREARERALQALYQLDIARPFEQWTVLARAGGDGEIALADLGLRRGTDYLAFEFWTHTALGIARDHLTLPPVDPGYQVQVVCLRARVDRPQVLSTSRHVSCGGPDLLDVRWADDTLSGTSELVPADPYAVFLTEPAGFRLEDVRTDGAAVVVQSMEGDTRVIRLLSPRGGPARWTARYARIH